MSDEEKYQIGNYLKLPDGRNVWIIGEFNVDGRLPVRERCGNRFLANIERPKHVTRPPREPNENVPIEVDGETPNDKAARIVGRWRDAFEKAIDRLVKRGPIANHANPVRVLRALAEVSR